MDSEEKEGSRLWMQELELVRDIVQADFFKNIITYTAQNSPRHADFVFFLNSYESRLTVNRSGFHSCQLLALWLGAQF